MCIISTAQHAKPNVSGHMEDLKPQFNKSSTRAKAYSTALARCPRGNMLLFLTADCSSEGKFEEGEEEAEEFEVEVEVEIECEAEKIKLIFEVAKTAFL